MKVIYGLQLRVDFVKRKQDHVFRTATGLPLPIVHTVLLLYGSLMQCVCPQPSDTV